MRQFQILNHPDWAARIVVEDGLVVLITSGGRICSQMTLEEILARPDIFREIKSIYPPI